MQMSKRVNKTKHSVRPVAKPAGEKSRFEKPNKVRRRNKRTTFNDLSQLKVKLEENEMRMGGTSVNAAKILKEVTQEKPTVALVEEPAVIVTEPEIIVKDLPSMPEGLNQETSDMLDESIKKVDSVLSDIDYDAALTAAKDVGPEIEEEDVIVTETHTRKVGMFGALCLGVRDTLFGQVVTAVIGR